MFCRNSNKAAKPNDDEDDMEDFHKKGIHIGGIYFKHALFIIIYFIGGTKPKIRYTNHDDESITGAVHTGL